MSSIFRQGCLDRQACQILRDRDYPREDSAAVRQGDSLFFEVESFKEGESLIDISALIYVERDSQKGIIIGKQGAMLKKLGMLARKDIEAFFGKKVMLKTFVKVEKDWRNNIRDLNLFGYNPE